LIPCKVTDDFAKDGLAYEGRCLFRRKPAAFPLVRFGPFFESLCHFKGKHRNPAKLGSTSPQSFFVVETAEGNTLDGTPNAGFFKRFLSRPFRRQHFAYRPTLGDQPAPGVPRCDEQNFNAFAPPPRQGPILLFGDTIIHGQPIEGFVKNLQLSRQPFAWHCAISSTRSPL
jgi:hypothetical protein